MKVWGLYATKVCEIPLCYRRAKGLLRQTTPHFYGFVGACFCKDGGWRFTTFRCHSQLLAWTHWLPPFCWPFAESLLQSPHSQPDWHSCMKASTYLHCREPDLRPAQQSCTPPKISSHQNHTTEIFLQEEVIVQMQKIPLSVQGMGVHWSRKRILELRSR